jgi:hypothetical protein
MVITPQRIDTELQRIQQTVDEVAEKLYAKCPQESMRLKMQILLIGAVREAVECLQIKEALQGVEVKDTLTRTATHYFKNSCRLANYAYRYTATGTLIKGVKV